MIGLGRARAGSGAAKTRRAPTLVSTLRPRYAGPVRRLYAIAASLLLLLGRVALPALACLCTPEAHACCCHGSGSDALAYTAPPADCCDDPESVQAVAAPSLDAARAVAPAAFSAALPLVPPPAALALLVRAPTPVAALGPRGPPKVPIFLRFEALLR